MASCTFVFLAVVLSAVLIEAQPVEQKYTTKYDNVDLDEILKNERLLKQYSNCLLGKGKCTPDGQELKKVLPDALESDCSKCNEKQLNGSAKVLDHLIKNKPEIYSELEKSYDPKGEYRKKFCKKAQNEGIDTKPYNC